MQSTCTQGIGHMLYQIVEYTSTVTESFATSIEV